MNTDGGENKRQETADENELGLLISLKETACRQDGVRCSSPRRKASPPPAEGLGAAVELRAPAGK